MSANATPFTRSNLGPLTTVFTPPPECSTVNFSPGGGIFWGLTCVNPGAPTTSLNSRCIPTDLGSFIDNVGPTPTLPIYSPGLECPRGFSGACTVVKASSPAISGSSSRIDAHYGIWQALAQGETAVKCCPSGFQCISAYGEEVSCGLPPPTASSTLTGTYYGDSCSVISYTTSWIPSASLYGVAPGVLIVQGSAQPSPTPTAGPIPQGSPKLKHSSGGGLSLGAKVAIGVAIPAILILALLGVCILLTRRRRRRERVSQLTHYDATAEASQDRDLHSTEKPALYASTAAREFDSSNTSDSALVSGALQGPSAASESPRTSRPLEHAGANPAYGLSASSLAPFPKKASESSRGQFSPNLETIQANRATSSTLDANPLRDRYRRSVEGSQLSYRSETASRWKTPAQPTPRAAHLVSQRTLEQLRAEHARVEEEISKHGKLERLKSQRDLLERQIEEIEEEPYVRG